MKRNMGPADRTIRIVVAIVLGYLILNSALGGFWAVIAGIFAVVFLVTSIVGFCPLYVPLKISTMMKQS